MLDIIHQNGTQKLSASNYYVDLQVSNDPNVVEDPATVPTNIIAYIENYGMLIIAQYDSYDDACAVFAHMVVLDREHGLAVLPKDDPTEIQEFLDSNGYEDYFLRKISK